MVTECGVGLLELYLLFQLQFSGEKDYLTLPWKREFYFLVPSLDVRYIHFLA